MSLVCWALSEENEFVLNVKKRLILIEDASLFVILLYYQHLTIVGVVNSTHHDVRVHDI